MARGIPPLLFPVKAERLGFVDPGPEGVVVVKGGEVQPQWERKSDKDVLKSKLCFSDCSGMGCRPEGSSNPGEEKIFLV